MDETRPEPGSRPACHDPYLRCAFYGAAQTVAGVRDCCVVAHSPQGCELLVSTALSWQQTDYLATKSVCTKLCEDEIVHGGEATLARVIEEAAAFRVRVAFVLTACGPEIVGDDVEAVCAEMARRVPFRLLPVRCPGFRGSQYDGVDLALEALLRAAPDASAGEKAGPVAADQRLPGTVALIAPHASGNPSWPGDLEWVREALGRLGLKVLATLTHRTPLEDLALCQRAEWSLLLSHDCGFRAQALLQESWGVRPLAAGGGNGDIGGAGQAPGQGAPMLPLPLGFSNTGRWLRGIAAELGRERAAEELIAEGEGFVVQQLRRQGLELQFFNRARLAVLADATLGIPLLGTIVEDLESEPVVVGLRSRHPRAVSLVAAECRRLGVSPAIHPGMDVYQAKKLLEEHRPDGVLGSNIEKHLADELGLPYAFRVVNPVSRFRLTNRAYFGYAGFLNLLEIVQNDWWDRFRSRRRRWEASW